MSATSETQLLPASIKCCSRIQSRSRRTAQSALHIWEVVAPRHFLVCASKRLVVNGVTFASLAKHNVLSNEVDDVLRVSTDAGASASFNLDAALTVPRPPARNDHPAN